MLLNKIGINRIIAVLLATAVVFLNVGAGTVSVRAAEAATDGDQEIVELDELFEDYFRVGVAVQAIDHWNDPTAEIGNPDKEKLIDACFNSMTFGNELKPAYNFDPASATLFKVDPAAEELLNWARQHEMPVRGHVLVWHSQVDPSIFAKDFKALSNGKVTKNENDELDEECLVDRDELIRRLRTYIYGVIEYTYANGYGDVIYAWDVVNEATEEKNPDGLRNSYWKRIIGPEFLYYSFLFAREATDKYAREYAADYGMDPDGDLSPILPELFYNDYNEWFDSRRDTIIRFISEEKYNPGQSLIKSEAIAQGGDGTILGDGLIDGIGMQGHLDDTQNIDKYITALEKYDECIGNVHITELDVGITGSGSSAYYKQAKFYYDFFSRLMQAADEGVGLKSVTFWGLTDDASWRKGADPLLFNGKLKPKSAFDAVVMAGSKADFTIAKVSDAVSADGSLYIDFEPTGDKLPLIPKLGFKSRGTGHQANLMLVNTDNHTENADTGYCLKVSRSEQDASVKLDVAGFKGNIISAVIYAKADDPLISLGLDTGDEPLIRTFESSSDWTELNAMFEISENADSVSLFVETDGSADIFIDDVTVRKGDRDSYEKYLKENESGNETTETAETAETAESPAPQPKEPGLLQRIINFFRGLF
ncbi:MAG: endo-1,4-beta-xylanase [Lachnospiraceae bacterium]|nr:endo-1,4-beta-xylanase [Lachnospiraceae bacterium]